MVLFCQMTSPPWSALTLPSSSTLLMAPENLLKGVLRRSPAWWASLTEGEQSQGSWASRFILPDKPILCLGWLAVPAAFTESHLGSKRSQRQILLWWRSPRTLVPRRFVLRIELLALTSPLSAKPGPDERVSSCSLSQLTSPHSWCLWVRTIPLEMQKCDLLLTQKQEPHGCPGHCRLCPDELGLQSLGHVCHRGSRRGGRREGEYQRNNVSVTILL